MTSVDVLHTGYTSPNVASTVVLVRDGDARIVVDPGMVARHSLILDPLAALGVDAGDVTHVFLSHHHPDHAMNVALFPNAEVVDFWARYIGDRWLDHQGDGHQLSPRARLLLVPGHTEEDAALVVDADDARYAMTHAWWRPDGPVIDPLAWDQARLERSRERILEVADIIVPGHGRPFAAAEAPGSNDSPGAAAARADARAVPPAHTDGTDGPVEGGLPRRDSRQDDRWALDRAPARPSSEQGTGVGRLFLSRPGKGRPP